MIIIPIGLQCTGSTFKNEINKTHSLPFDWMFATPLFVYEMLILLLEQNMNIKDLVNDYFFNCNKRADISDVEHYYISDNGFALYNSKYNVIFPHDEYNIDTIDKYIRRFERLKDIILNSEEEINFIYISQSSLNEGNYTIDNINIIEDVYINLSNIYKLINKYRTNYKLYIFDSILNENIELLDKNIILHKLNSCENWTYLLSQLRQYTHLFV